MLYNRLGVVGKKMPEKMNLKIIFNAEFCFGIFAA